jgi:adenylate cyclase
MGPVPEHERDSPEPPDETVEVEAETMEAPGEESEPEAGLIEAEAEPGSLPGAPAPASPQKLSTDPRLLKVAKGLRKILPGDSQFGEDPLSTAGDTQSQVLGRRLAEATAERPTLLREAGLSALQVLDAFAQTAGRIPVKADLTIAFTDLVDFSKWSLKAGDDAAVDLLRQVSVAIEPPVGAHTGKVVKRLGDGMMAVFAGPTDALAAIQEAQARLAEVDVGGYRPRLRAGMHVGRPERVGNDYFGVDVNTAARIAAAASANEILVSDRVLAELDSGSVRARRKLLFRAKGVPGEVKVYAVSTTG